MFNCWQSIQKERKIFTPWREIALSGLVLFSVGCVSQNGLFKEGHLNGGSQIQVQQSDAHTETTENMLEQHASKIEDQQNTNVVPLKAGDMYQLLVAEMMALKGFEAQAYDIVFKIAYKLRTPELAERAFKLSMKTYNAQKIEAATMLWREVAPEATTPWRASLLIALRQNNVEQALADWQHYRTLSKEPLERDLLIVAQKIGVSAPPKAGLSFLQQLVKAYPETWASYFALGLAADGFNQFDVALKALEKAKIYQTEDSEPQINQFLAKLYLQNPPAKRGIKALKPYLEKNPQDWLVQERLARLEVHDFRYDDAIKRYQLILEAMPDAYTSRLSLALVQLEKEDYKAAEKNLLKVASKKGFSDVVNYYLGLIYQELADTKKALTFFDKVKLGHYYVDARLHQAEIYFSEGEQSRAFTILSETKAEKPDELVKLHRAKAIFYSAAGQQEDAVKEYSKVLELEPNNIRALMNQAMLFYELKQFELYVANLKRVIKINPNEADALNALGYFYVDDLKKLSEAEVLLNKAYQLEPSRYYILDSVGWLYFKKGNYAKAKEYLQKALAIQMDDEVLVHLIQAHWKLGEKKQARMLWQNNNKKFLQNSELQGLINLLESKSKE
ncbi:hypothetical protein MNBD_GAMMA03-709 [hydrothermal vent metagenome]|uniref:Uncharacterized protein n=1 Tax=hydrothermal vent metagenome TaxID=652676 RepID=A0A3B0VY41_9ZZZZ